MVFVTLSDKNGQQNGIVKKSALNYGIWIDLIGKRDILSSKQYSQATQ